MAGRWKASRVESDVVFHETIIAIGLRLGWACLRDGIPTRVGTIRRSDRDVRGWVCDAFSRRKRSKFSEKTVRRLTEAGQGVVKRLTLQQSGRRKPVDFGGTKPKRGYS